MKYTVLLVLSILNLLYGCIENDLHSDRSKKNYLKTSYELSNYEDWINIDQVYKSPSQKENMNIFITTEICQLDYDSDGFEDIFCADPDSLINILHPQILYRNSKGYYLKQINKIPRTTGCKLLVGDFNNDSFPDIFSLSAVDFPVWQDGMLPCNLLINEGDGNFTKTEFPGNGFWYAGASGDIDNDGDLDIVMMNFHAGFSGEKSRLLRNDGKGNFITDYNEIGDLTGAIDQAELVDINNDDFLDLIINRANWSTTGNEFEILWGNGSTFSEENISVLPLTFPDAICTVDFVDVEGDKIMEILITYTPSPYGSWVVYLFKSDDNGITFTDATNKYVPENSNKTGDGMIRFLRVQDIDKNGKMDIFNTDKKANTRWEQDVDGVFRRKY